MNSNNYLDDFILVKKVNKTEFNSFTIHEEADEYMGCEYIYQNKKYIQRTSKITPTKIGQFVTLWKRNHSGITEPFEEKDDLDFVVIICKCENKIGRFLFPKNVLIEKGILTTQNGKDGKRGFRVYPEWDIAENKQAKATQAWQIKYFLTNLRLI